MAPSVRILFFSFSVFSRSGFGDWRTSTPWAHVYLARMTLCDAGGAWDSNYGAVLQLIGNWQKRQSIPTGHLLLLWLTSHCQGGDWAPESLSHN